jgi:NADH-quinone oxidoreductase subunit N
MLVSDGVAYFWKVLLLLFVMGVVLMWFATTAQTMHEGDGPEFFTLLLTATLGMSFMGSASNLLMLFMAVEMASLPSYVLAGFRKTHRVGAEASLKYVLFGAATSAVMAYGLSLLYGLYGTLQLYTTQSGPGLAELMVIQGATSPLLVVAVFGLIVGLGFKISAVPFHFWCPDVFEGASIEVTTFLSVASKGAGLVLLLRVVMAVADAAGYQPTGVTTWTAVVIGVLGSLTCTVGNTAAYFQTNIKRLLAYSSIAHAGYMLCAVSLLVRHGRDLENPGNSAAQAVLVYLAVYVFMNLGAFTVAALVARQSGTEDLSGYRNLGRRSPILAGCMALFLLSLIGLPPLAGFWAKVNVLWVLIQNGGWWWALVAVIGVNTILSAFYYFRVIKPMFLESSDAPAFTPGPLGTGLGVACAMVLVVLFVGWNGLTRVSTYYSRLRPAEASATARPTTQPAPPAPVAAAR